MNFLRFLQKNWQSHKYRISDFNVMLSSTVDPHWALMQCMLTLKAIFSEFSGFFFELFGSVVNYGKKQLIQLQNFVLLGHPKDRGQPLSCFSVFQAFGNHLDHSWDQCKSDEKILLPKWLHSGAILMSTHTDLGKNGSILIKWNRFSKNFHFDSVQI